MLLILEKFTTQNKLTQRTIYIYKHTVNYADIQTKTEVIPRTVTRDKTAGNTGW